MYLTKKIIKKQTHLYNYTMLKQIFQKLNFFVVFFFDVFDSETRNNLFLFLNANNLKSFLIKNKIVKTLLNKKQYLKLKNFLINNTIFIFNKQNNLISNIILKNLMKTYNLNFLFCVWNKKIYKISSFEKYYLTNENFNLKLLIVLKELQKRILVQLTNKKFSI